MSKPSDRVIYSGYRVGKPDGGPECEAFERELEGYYRIAHARVMHSATAALHASLVALGIKAGDKVLVPALTMSATAAAVLHAGATPIFVDVADDYCIDWEDARSKTDQRVKAIMLVHLFGHHAVVPDWANYLGIVHDAAQAPRLRPAASSRAIYVYSLNQWKVITCGEGGYALTSDKRLADRLHAVRNHGECYTPDIVGYNYRMTELQARIARLEFGALNRRMKERCEWAERKKREFGRDDPGNIDWFLFPMRTEPDRRADLAGRVGGRVGYHKPIYRLPYFQANGYANVLCPNAEVIENELVVVDPLTCS